MEECIMSVDPHQHQRSSALTRVSIRSLPFEVLLAIFKIVYADSASTFNGVETCLRDRYVAPGEPQADSPPSDGSIPIPLVDPRAGDPIIDPLSHTNFPYSVASVCTQWRDIVLTEPIFWASPIITVGACRPLFEPTSQSHFELSRDYFLDIKIVCREELSASQPSSEQADVMALLPYIYKVFHRCNSISFHLNRSSSLPSLARHFGTVMWNLEHVELRCKIDDGRNTLPAPCHCHAKKGFSCTWSLVVDGHNLKDLIKYPGERRGLRRLGLLSDIVISGYSASASEPDPLSLYDMLKALEDVGIMRLTLQNIDLDLAVPATVSKPNVRLLGMRAVSFEDLSGDLIDAAFGFALDLVANTRITRCSLPRSKIRTRHLTLEAINKEENLHSFLLSRWRGRALSVKDCPQFNDTPSGTVT
ncbi:hypothetical protein SERLA73DRAFT_187165 [Serpula lacrymans var. lacrymans S7.3]|uniref:F-box domain-containing protein n=1 Tax=Serpula lacrymans var. lacrymans (strain S7.3) TaxID=936435 RepID=F8Q8K8_SERL3|nr:hypothetical protein SERLA73DRAFT_187165 [Serpula lacrymans var. lacrymans S7.3]